MMCSVILYSIKNDLRKYGNGTYGYSFAVACFSCVTNFLIFALSLLKTKELAASPRSVVVDI